MLWLIESNIFDRSHITYHFQFTLSAKDEGPEQMISLIGFEFTATLFNIMHYRQGRVMQIACLGNYAQGGTHPWNN